MTVLGIRAHFVHFYLALACASRGLCDRSWCPFIYICMYICMYIIICEPPKFLNGTLVVDSPFQTLAVDLSSNID